MSSERQTIYAMNNDLQPQKIKSVYFGFELAMSLIRPQIEQRSLIGINSSVVRKIESWGKNILQTCKNVKWLFSPSKSKVKAIRCMYQ